MSIFFIVKGSGSGCTTWTSFKGSSTGYFRFRSYPCRKARQSLSYLFEHLSFTQKKTFHQRLAMTMNIIANNTYLPFPFPKMVSRYSTFMSFSTFSPKPFSSPLLSLLRTSGFFQSSCFLFEEPGFILEEPSFGAALEPDLLIILSVSLFSFSNFSFSDLGSLYSDVDSFQPLGPFSESLTPEDISESPALETRSLKNSRSRA